MRNLILLALLVAVCAFAQTEVNWWVFDGGGAMRSPSAGDTLYASIGQPVIGCRVESHTSICAGYLCVFEGTCTKIDENPGEDGKPTEKPYVFGINSITPNPFNPTTSIEFEIEDNKEVTFEFFDVLGRVVDTPIRGEIMEPGRYKLTWGGDLPSGNYFARLSTPQKQQVKKLLYLK